MRTVSQDYLDTMNNENSYKISARLDIYKSRIFSDTISVDSSLENCEVFGQTLIPQEIAINGTAGFVTFFVEGGYLCYRTDDDEIATTITTTGKPGVFGTTIFVPRGTSVYKYTIDYSKIATLDPAPFTEVENKSFTCTSTLAIHATSATEAIILLSVDGMLTVSTYADKNYWSGRYFFTSYADKDGLKPIAEVALYSTATKFGSDIFVYISNDFHGNVIGLKYDTVRKIWSDSYTAVPTDLQVSLCQFQVTSSYVANSKIYLVGQFIRTDVLSNDMAYTLILSSTNGKNFSIDQFSLVSTLQYRFQALFDNDIVYLSSCGKRIELDATWPFNGDDVATTCTSIPLSKIKEVTDTNLESLTFSLSAGDEAYIADPNLAVLSRVKFYVGFDMDVNEDVLYGTYIISDIKESYANGVRTLKVSCMSEAVWRMSSLSMPYYVEISGKSSIFDPLTVDSGNLYSATTGSKTMTSFQIDFWNHEPYSNTTASITGINMIQNGGVNYYESSGNHKLGIINKDSIQQIKSLSQNPKITSATLPVKIHGWSHPTVNGNPNDKVNLVLVLCDENEENEETIITSETDKWKITYPYSAAGEEPISFSISTTSHIGKYIKKVGVIFECANTTWFNIARVEFTSGVEIPVGIVDSGTPWTNNDGIFEIPTPGMPFIMFSQRPHSKINVDISAKFSNTVTGGITNYPIATGLILLAMDSNNYICARYDKVSNKIQLVIARNGIESTITSGSPTFTVPDEYILSVTHKDSVFTIYLSEDGITLEKQLEYKWKSTDGFMFGDEVIAPKTGIYGVIMAPSVLILGYNGGSTDDTQYSDGIAVDPLTDLSDFPSTGQLRIGMNVYSYDGVISMPAIPRGPYQYRQSNTYAPPYGNGSAGLEVRDFDYLASASLIDDLLIAIDSGVSFVSTGALWQCWDTQGGVRRDFYNRARYYSDNAQISSSGHSLFNRVWVTGGFTNISQVSGDSDYHSVGDLATLNLEGKIQCFWFSGSGGEQENTIQDLCKTVCEMAGVEVEFPSNIEVASLAVNGVEELFEDEYAEGYAFQFDTTSMDFAISVNTGIVPDNYEEDLSGDTDIDITFSDLGANLYSVSLISQPSNTTLITRQFSIVNSGSTDRIKIFGNDTSVGIYANDVWITTLCVDDFSYGNSVIVSISGTLTLTNLEVQELADGREAIFIDLDTDAMSGLGSIIQERPIKMINTSTGGLRLWYTRDTWADTFTSTLAPRSHEITHQNPGKASDAIVYSKMDAKTLQYKSYAENFGLSTKILRIPNLDTGATEAALRMLEDAYRTKEIHDIVTRPIPTLEPTDKMIISYSLSATEKAMSTTIWIDNISLTIQGGRQVTSSMRISGRP